MRIPIVAKSLETLYYKEMSYVYNFGFKSIAVYTSLQLTKYQID